MIRWYDSLKIALQNARDGSRFTHAVTKVAKKRARVFRTRGKVQLAGYTNLHQSWATGNSGVAAIVPRRSFLFFFFYLFVFDWYQSKANTRMNGAFPFMANVNMDKFRKIYNIFLGERRRLLHYARKRKGHRLRSVVNSVVTSFGRIFRVPGVRVRTSSAAVYLFMRMKVLELRSWTPSTLNIDTSANTNWE